VFQIELRYPFSCYRRRAWDEYCSSSAALVDDGQDGIASLALWKLCDQVHGDHLKGEGCVVSRDVEQWCLPSVCEIFVLLTGRTPFDVVGYSVVHARPPEDRAHCLNGLVSSGVPCGWAAVVAVDYVSLQGLFWGNYKLSVGIPELETRYCIGRFKSDGSFLSPLEYELGKSFLCPCYSSFQVYPVLRGLHAFHH
jgi:hypothetical protein